MSNWVYAVTAVSVLFNLMGMWGRFRLSRIDAQRVKAEGRIAALFRPGITAAEIVRLAPTPEHRAVRHRAEVTDLVATLETLSARCRQESRSWAADMGQEMPYRYQEHLMAELLDGLRSFRTRVDEGGQGGDAASSRTGFGRWAVAKGNRHPGGYRRAPLRPRRHPPLRHSQWRRPSAIG